MIRCSSCQSANLDSSRFCDECGSRLLAAAPEKPPAYVPPPQQQNSMPRSVSVTSIGVPPVGLEAEARSNTSNSSGGKRSGVAHATLVIERGDSPGTEFRLTNEESTIGRWDADNGVFPDVDLDAFDSDAKVSRRHARIVKRQDSYFIEDLGSTNGTYVNRGRRLLPGNSQILNDGDEVIVGKTFLRFQIHS
jgi:pSer/pThr/pTyr-binding forkhead associated (FHA) protein